MTSLTLSGFVTKIYDWIPGLSLALQPRADISERLRRYSLTQTAPVQLQRLLAQPKRKLYSALFLTQTALVQLQRSLAQPETQVIFGVILNADCTSTIAKMACTAETQVIFGVIL